MQLSQNPGITLDRGSKLIHPKLMIGHRHGSSFAIQMSMPKATVHHDDRAILWKNQIGISRQILSVELIAKSKVVKGTAKNPFRLGVLTSDF